MLHFPFVVAVRATLYMRILCGVLIFLTSCTFMRQSDLIVEMPIETSPVDQVSSDALIDAVKKRFYGFSNLENSGDACSGNVQNENPSSQQTLKRKNENSEALLLRKGEQFASIASLIANVDSHIASGIKSQNSTLLAPLLSRDSESPRVNNASSILNSVESESPNVRDIARQLAGLDLIALSPTVVENFRNITTRGWNKLKTSVFDPLRDWRQRCFPAIDANRVFYPFGGPDAAYVTQFFPDANVYILVGLEATGSVESARNILKNDNHLQLFSRGMEHFLNKGYFVTSYMGTQLSSSKVGVIPAILSQLAQLGFDVVDVRNVGLTEKGEICEEREGKLKLTQIRFQSSGGEKTLFYVRCSLENSNQENVELLCQFVNSGKFITFIKSGAYRLYDTKLFSNLRTFILENSTAILQDDTGIPYHFLIDSYRVRLFGSYSRPSLRTFHAYRQNDLAEAYEDQTIDPLPFRIGYGSSTVPSNLLLAISNHVGVQ